MRHYLINDDHVTLCHRPPTRLAEGCLLVSSAQDLYDSTLTVQRLLAIHSGLPGTEPATKVPNRKAAIERLWAALPTLPAPKHKPGAKQVAGKRPASKQARVIEMLRRPEGVSVDAIAKKMGWQRHTVRGLIAGALRKKLGLIIVTDKAPGGTRHYRITETQR